MFGCQELLYDVACGSVVGSDHIASGKCLIGQNNQDAMVVHRGEDVITAFICDGCGSGRHSEVGAWLAANILTQKVVEAYDVRGVSDIEATLERIRKDTLAQIRMLANSLGGRFRHVIHDYFLFTAVGLIITHRDIHIATIGDGFYATYNSDQGFITNQIGPFPNNQPPYMSYDLVDTDIDPDLIKFDVRTFNPLACPAVMIGSDGVVDLLNAAASLIPGTTEEVGGLQQFLTNDLYFMNSDAISRRLRRCNSEVNRLDHQSGRIKTHRRLLPDDTTLVCMRRMEQQCF